ncbi:VanZ family protein [Pedobacter sp. BS3]|uniref:VanZ family protein n=1 Tax=Pedobacter sp. BS3 TaxID=2567937 RepID=UPI0011EEF449|nr:VanZ family protein [Pedobacter sp. BS3]TZF84447.1 VanZ family protein [Pedobacter sp. BS3]
MGRCSKQIGLFITAYLVLVILALSVPVTPLKQAMNNVFIFHIRLDHIFHGSLFVPWMFLQPAKNNRLKAGYWLAIGLVITVLAEYIQLGIPYRTFNVNDIRANVAGMLTGAVFYRLTMKHTR